MTYHWCLGWHAKDTYVSRIICQSVLVTWWSVDLSWPPFPILGFIGVVWTKSWVWHCSATYWAFTSTCHLKGLCQLESMRAEAMQITVKILLLFTRHFLCHVQGSEIYRDIYKRIGLDKGYFDSIYGTFPLCLC